MNIGVAASNYTASEGGPRCNSLMTPEEHSSIENGTWLCQNHAKLLDSEGSAFPEELLRR